MTCGLLCCLLVTYLASRKEIIDEEGHPVHLTFQLLAYFPWLYYEMVLANLQVAYHVWNPKSVLSPLLIKVPYKTQSDLVTVIFANSITMTPGTVTVSVDEKKKEILVHALTEKFAKELLSGRMQERIQKLEARDKLL